jgi:hypothetical protein
MKILGLFLLLIVAVSCNKKEEDYYVYGTVVDGQGCYAGSRLVWIDHPLPVAYDFLCKDAPASGMNCGNSVFVMDIPASLAVTGQKLMFRGWTTKVSCFSSTTAPNHIEVKDIKAR